MKKLLHYLQVMPALGWQNVFYIVWYRISLRLGIRRLLFPQRTSTPSSGFFREGAVRQDYPTEWRDSLINSADKITSGYLRYYSRHWEKTGSPPDWFLDPFYGLHHPDAGLHWTKVSEYNDQSGDIKNIWEASRFGWAVTLAMAFSVTGDKRYINTINAWLENWVSRNPLNTGPNWRCGQEASVRVINLVIAAELLEPTHLLRDLVYAHLGRIRGNIGYALAQDNNHGTSEAAGLFIGGYWLAAADGNKYDRAAGYASEGRRWLEERVARLVEADGSFSQHSVNYHRMLTDTLTFAEYFRKKFSQKPFSPLFYNKAEAAVTWLQQLTDEESGRAPNLGANDGTILNQLHQSSYLDFRASLQLAGSVFSDRKFYNNSKADEPLYWLKIPVNGNNKTGPLNESRVLGSGYVVLRSSGSWCLLRLPHFKFRPSDNDVFHIDLWHNGKNVLIDSGTFSYNPRNGFKDINLRSVRCHNTVAFDDHEQMPALSRFLMGDWIKPVRTGKIRNDESDTTGWEGAYKDCKGNLHSREVTVSGNTWTIKDTVEGNFNFCAIGFNINDVGCRLSGQHLRAAFGMITLPEDSEVRLSDSFVSEYYNELTPVKRIEARVYRPGTYTTVIQLEDQPLP